MDSQATTNNANTKDKKTEKTIRVWTSREEEVLLQALKEAISCGWKSENGFRYGYVVFLEDALKKFFLSTDLRGNPHINSKIHVWKKTHSTLTTLLSKSRIGWNDSDKTIDATNEACESFVKCDNSVCAMRYKPWPYYNEWCELFYNDRAIGENAESFIGAVQDVLNLDFQIISPTPEHKKYVECGDFDESMATIAPFSSSNASGIKKITCKKRKFKAEAQELFVQAMNNFTDVTREILKDLAFHFGYKYEMLKETKEVFKVLGSMLDITKDEQVIATEMLVERPKKLALFFSLLDQARRKLVCRLLNAI